MRKPRLLTLLAVLTTAALLAGCGSDSESGSAKKETTTTTTTAAPPVTLVPNHPTLCDHVDEFGASLLLSLQVVFLDMSLSWKELNPDMANQQEPPEVVEALIQQMRDQADEECPALGAAMADIPDESIDTFSMFREQPAS